jgi:hypothetical protein
MGLLYNAISKTIILHRKITRYLSYIIPSHISSITRFDVENGRVLDDYCVRGKLRENNFYLIATWNRQSYQRYFISSAVLARDIGTNEWESLDSRDLVRVLTSLYSVRAMVETGILAVLVNDIDISEHISDMRSTLSIPNNLTAAAIALYHKYVTQDTVRVLPYYASFQSFAIDLLENIERQDRVESNTQLKNWVGIDDTVTVIDYELNETRCKRNEYIR